MFILFDLDIHMKMDQEKKIDKLFRGIPYSKKTRTSGKGNKSVYLKNLFIKLVETPVILDNYDVIKFVDNIMSNSVLQNATQKQMIKNSLLAEFGKDEQIETVGELYHLEFELKYKRVYKIEDIKIIYSDGSFNKNTEVGGFGVCELTQMTDDPGAGVDLLTGNKYNYSMHKGATDEEEGTNNIGELMGVGKAFEIATRSNKSISIVVSDSNYSISCIREWYYNWKDNNWKTYNKKPVKNKELIQEIYKKKEDNLVLMCWTKAHVDTFFNEECDRLAREAVGL